MTRHVRDEILRLLLDRIPNFVPKTTIKVRVGGATEAEIDSALEQLVNSEQIEFRDDPRPQTGLSMRFYRLKSFAGLPIRETVTLGEVELPRLLSDSIVSLFPEVLNEAIEQLADYNRTLEVRFKGLVQAQQRKYWANVAGLFGVFVSVLALIIVGLPQITTNPQLPFWSLVQLNLAQLLPLAIVLAIFVCLIQWIIRP